jgi:hypothetical protein
MSEDPFEGYTQPLSGPAITSALAIIPNDDADLPVIPRGFMCLNGDIRVTMKDGQTVDLKGGPNIGVPVGYGLRVRRIHATGTTATNFVLLW